MRPMATATGDSVDVILRDGGTLRLRPPRARRRAGAARLLSGALERRASTSASTASRISGLAGRAAARAGLGRARRPARGARRRGRRARRRARQLRAPARSGGGRVGVRGRRPQGRGIGTRLLEQLAARAADGRDRALRRRGAGRQPPMLGVFERAGFELTRELADGEVEVEFPIASTRALRAARRRARPRGRRRVAAPVLRAATRRGHRRLVATRLDRRRAVPQHPRGATSRAPPTR